MGIMQAHIKTYREFFKLGDQGATPLCEMQYSSRQTGKYLICLTCKKQHYVIVSLLNTKKYCSLKCRPGKPKKGINRICKQCESSFYISQAFVKTAKYCSYKCMGNAYKKRVIKKCDTCQKDYEVRISQIKWRGSKYCSKKCMDIGASKRMGELSPNWQGGKSYEYRKIRKGIKWKTWRESVFKRDNYTCQKCGAKSSKKKAVELHPHHIKEYAKYPKQRFVIKNGLTVCKECHYKIHSI